MSENSTRNDRRPAHNPFPESELPRWLWRKAREHAIGFWRAIPGPPYQLLARFSHDLRTCIRSAIDMARALEMCVKSVSGTRLADRWAGAAEMVRGGSSLTEALGPARELLPPFYLPVIRAGERSGRLDEAFAFLESHCKLLAGPASAIRKVWLYPLAILLFGSFIRIILVLFGGSLTAAISLLVGEVFSWLQLAVIVAVVMLTPVRPLLDELRLSLPLVGPLEREIALHRFFRVLALMYGVGGDRVEEMIRIAANTVDNRAARKQLMSAAEAIQQQATIPEAFRRVTLLTSDEQATIETGELSGTLEIAFDQISDQMGASMIHKLNILQPLLTRIVIMVVVFSIIGTMLSLL